MYLFIFSQEKPIFTGEVKSVRLPGSVAPFEVLKNHAEIVTILEKGTLTYLPIKGSQLSVEVKEGIAKVKDDDVLVLMK